MFPPFISINIGLCYHYFGGFIPFLAKHMATVHPSLFYKSGLCSHSFGGIIPLLDKLIATVFPLYP